MEKRVGWTNIFFSHDDTNASGGGGVAILFKSSKMYKVKKLVSDDAGRMVALEISLEVESITSNCMTVWFKLGIKIIYKLRNTVCPFMIQESD